MSFPTVGNEKFYDYSLPRYVEDIPTVWALSCIYKLLFVKGINVTVESVSAGATVTVD